jgi:hypothetical protein
VFGGLTAAEYTKHCDEVRMAEITEKHTAALLALAAERKAKVKPSNPQKPKTLRQCERVVADLYIDTLKKSPRLKNKTQREIYRVIYESEAKLHKQKTPPFETWQRYIRRAGELQYNGLENRPT